MGVTLEEINTINKELCVCFGIENGCPSFGVGYSESEKHCAHCWEDCNFYSKKCKELSKNKDGFKRKEVKKMSEEKEKPVKEKKVTASNFIKKLVCEHPDYTLVQVTEEFAKTEVKSTASTIKYEYHNTHNVLNILKELKKL